MPSVAHALGSLLVVAFGNLADPVGPIANDGRQLGRGVALGKKPQDLPLGPFVRLFGRPVAVFEFVES